MPGFILLAVVALLVVWAIASYNRLVGMANETNRLASGYQVEIDERFKN